MFKFNKNEDKGEDFRFDSEELDLNVLEKEIVELVDIVEDSEPGLETSGEIKLTEGVSEDGTDDSPLDDVEFPTEVRQIAEELHGELPDIDEIAESTSLDLRKELEKESRKRPYGDKVIAETLGLGEDDSLVTALKSEKVVGVAGDEEPDVQVGKPETDPTDEDRTLLVNMSNAIGDLTSDLESEDEEGLLTLTEELNDEKNTTVDTAALKNCPLIEDSAEIKLKQEPDVKEKEVEEGAFQKTKVDLSLSQILSTDSLEADLKEELKEDFMSDSEEMTYEKTEVEMPSPVFELKDEIDETEFETQVAAEEVSIVTDKELDEPVAMAAGSTLPKTEPVDFKQSEAIELPPQIDKEKIVEKILDSIKPEITEMVKEAVREQLPDIIEKIVLEEIAKIKKFMSES